MKKYCLTLDLKNDPVLIDEYEQWHRNVWPEIRNSILDSGITKMEIFRLDNRMCMLIEADDHFSFEKKSAMDASNKKVGEWEELMWRFQQPLPNAAPGEKWMLMEKFFELKS